MGKRNPFRVASLGPVVTLAAGCGFTFSPGDYSAPGDPASLDDAKAIPETGIAGDGGTGGGDGAKPDAGPLPASLHVLLFSGASDVWLATVNDAGDVGPFGYLQPTPITKPLQALAIADGKILAVAPGASSRIVQAATFDEGITSGWTAASVQNAPRTSFGSFFLKSGSLVTLGGQTSQTTTDKQGNPQTVTTNHMDLYVSKRSASQYADADANKLSTTKLPANVFAPTVVQYKDFVYLWGRGDTSEQAATVYFGKSDEALGLATATATTKIVGADARPHLPTSPSACAGEGQLFIVGGDNNVKTTLSAAINETSGELGAWKAGKDLPLGRATAGCAVIKGWLYLFGGNVSGETSSVPAAPSAEILRAKVAADGSLGEWDKTAQALPAPRANVFALTY